MISIPIGLKTGLPGDYGMFQLVNHDIVKNKLDFLSVGGLVTPSSSGVDIMTGKTRHPSLSIATIGQSYKYMAAGYLLIASKAKKLKSKLHISAAMGISSWMDIVEFIMLGANSVQITSLLLKNGPEIIETMTRNLPKYLDKFGFKNFEEIRAIALKKAFTTDSFPIQLLKQKNDYQGIVYAEVDHMKCVWCRNCLKVCMYGAIYEDKQFLRRWSRRSLSPSDG